MWLLHFSHDRLVVAMCLMLAQFWFPMQMVRYCWLPWLGWLLVGCDKSPRVAGDRPEPEVAGGVHGSHARRALPAEPPRKRDQLRAQLQQARQLGSPEERNRAVAAVVWEALELDPELAREGFDQLLTGSAEKNRLIQHDAMRMAEQNAAEALQWAASLATDEEKSLAYGTIALVLAESDPPRAAKLLSETGLTGREHEVAVVQVVQRWAAMSPADAGAWVALFDAGDARQAGLKTVVGVWAMKEPQAAMAWIEALSDETIRHEAERGLIETAKEQAPERLDDWLRLAPPGIQSRLETLR